MFTGRWVSAGPNAAISTARASVAAPHPYNEEGQLRVVPTASTIVRASTASTQQARKTDATSAITFL